MEFANLLKVFFYLGAFKDKAKIGKFYYKRRVHYRNLKDGGNKLIFKI